MADEHVNRRPARSVIHLLISGALYIAVGGAVLTWAWNRVGHELFGWPMVTYVHGVASLAALLVLSMPLRLGRSWQSLARKHGSERHDMA